MLEHRYCAVQGKEVFISFVDAVREVIVVEDVDFKCKEFVRGRCVLSERLDG